MKFKITYVLYLNDLNIIKVHKTEIQNKIYVLSTQKPSWKMQEMKLLWCRFCQFKSTLFKVTKAKVYKTPATHIIMFCWIWGLPWLVELAASGVSYLYLQILAYMPKNLWWQPQPLTLFIFTLVCHVFNLPTLHSSDY